jgi:cobalamin biosynthesis protein CobD/CbiB
MNADERTPLPYLIVGTIRSVTRKIEILARHFKTLLASIRRKCRRSLASFVTRDKRKLHRIAR